MRWRCEDTDRPRKGTELISCRQSVYTKLEKAERGHAEMDMRWRFVRALKAAERRGKIRYASG